MKRKPPTADSNKDEYRRFREVAREVEASDDPKDLERAVKRIAPVTKRPSYGS